MTWTPEAIELLGRYGGKIELYDRELWELAQAAAKDHPDEIRVIASRELPAGKMNEHVRVGRLPFGGIIATERGIQILEGWRT